MECYSYEIPTTGSVSFTEICIDHSRKYAANLAAATMARASLRAALKESKKADGEKDYLKLVKVLDDYLPQLYALITTVETGEIKLKSEPVFSWKTTLCQNLLHSSSRISAAGLLVELAFSLLTYAFVISNLACSTVISLHDYEYEPHITDDERRTKDEKLNLAVKLLCRASGIFSHITETVLPQWESSNPDKSTGVPGLNKDVITSLSHLAISDAQSLAIRKLMSKSAYDSLISVGPPLPKSHPSPALIAKLYLHVASSYSSARGLIASHKDSQISPDLRKYLAHGAALAPALAHKWLGVDAGESGSRGGDAVAFLKWAKTELRDLRDGAKKVPLGIASDSQSPRNRRMARELQAAEAFLKTYQKMNDSVHFQPVPAVSQLQSLIPTGKSAVVAKPFEPPRPIFGPGSLAYAEQRQEATSPDTTESNIEISRQYAGAGSYF